MISGWRSSDRYSGSPTRDCWEPNHQTMSSLIIDLNERYKKAFGYLPKMIEGNVIAQHNTIVAAQSLAASVAGRLIDTALVARSNNRPKVEPYGHKLEGVEILVNDSTFADLKIKSAKNGKVYEFRNNILTEGDGSVLAAAPMLKFDRTKKITATTIAGSDNTVVEDMGLNQWEITMSGILVDMSSHQYPSAKMKQLRELFETPDVFEILECQVMTDLGINAIYFSELHDIQVLEDYPDTVKYQLKAKSLTQSIALTD